jgi:hypothetical protein
MYNRVLSRYTSNVDENNFNSTTLHKWADNWWKVLASSGELDEGELDEVDKIFVECPFKEKDEAKALGARWDVTEIFYQPHLIRPHLIRQKKPILSTSYLPTYVMLLN